MEKRYYWLKLQEDFFSSPKIKKLRRIAGGDTYTVIYLKMQLLSIKSGGIIEYQGIEPTFAEELALILDEDEENVKVTLSFLASQGLIEQSDSKSYLLTQAAENIGSESESASRVRAFRGKQKEKALQCNADVTGCNNLLTLDKERDKEKDKDKESNREAVASPTPASVPYSKIKELYNSICTAYPKCTAMSDARKKAIAARIHSGYTVEDFQRVFEKAQASSFLKGRNNRNWRASFDWLLKDSNMAKVLDGNYDDKDQTTPHNPAEDDLDFIPN